jgi:acyl dehydratase
MSLDDFLRTGVSVPIGSYRFDAERIKSFARRFDPQSFHLDEEAARASLFGGLCASGWHTASAWMKCNVASRMDDMPWAGPGPRPEYGPSPGFRNLKWPKPVYADQTVSYFRTVLGHRALSSRRGWRMVSTRGEGLNESGDLVISFESAVLLKVA